MGVIDNVLAPSKASQIITLMGMVYFTPEKTEPFFWAPCWNVESRYNVHHMFFTHKIHFDVFWEVPHLYEVRFFQTTESCENQPRDFFF